MAGRLFLCLCLCLTGAVLAGGPASAQQRNAAAPDPTGETRIALVIGNGAYSDAPLRNPPNDARLMAKTLKSLGFDVIERIDADQKTMKRALSDFSARLEKAGENAIGLVFYAGHGIQSNGRNYLIPVKATVETEADLRIETVDASEVLGTMEYAKSRLNFVIMDACRNNPLLRRFRSSSRGLARMEAPSGTLIAYATRPGDVAADGTGDNSPYTSSLIKAMTTSGLPVTDMFIRVRNDVIAATGGKQTPWEEGGLTSQFYFARASIPSVPAPTKAETSPVAEPNRTGFELEYWQSIKGSSDIADFEAYLVEYPKGQFTRLASNRIKTLTAQKAAEAATRKATEAAAQKATVQKAATEAVAQKAAEAAARKALEEQPPKTERMAAVVAPKAAAPTVPKPAPLPAVVVNPGKLTPDMGADVGELRAFPIGLKVQNPFSIGGVKVPLPEGEWFIAGRGVSNETDYYSSYGFRGRSTRGAPVANVILENTVEGTLRGLIAIRATLDATAFSWPRSEDCGRDTVIFTQGEDISGVNSFFCWWVDHWQMPFAGKADKQVHIAEWKKTFAARNLTAPVNMVSAGFFISRSERYLHVEYFSNPESAGIAGPRYAEWESSDWHKDSLAQFPDKAQYVEQLKSWALGWREKMKTGFDGKS